jgi:hypothetical protein
MQTHRSQEFSTRRIAVSHLFTIATSGIPAMSMLSSMWRIISECDKSWSVTSHAQAHHLTEQWCACAPLVTPYGRQFNTRQAAKVLCGMDQQQAAGRENGNGLQQSRGTVHNA